MATPQSTYSDFELQSINPDSLEYLKLSPADKRRYQQLSIRGVGGSILFADEPTQKKLIEEFGPKPEETIAGALQISLYWILLMSLQRKQ